MSSIGQIIATVLWLYLLVLLARLVLDLVQTFSREWTPKGLLLLFAEAVYTLTDPPLNLLRKVIPPLKIGGVALDLAFIVLFILLQVAIAIAGRF
ncbi:MAG: YggT family protein [Actinomycetota bacterium]|jgi:YggT family protein|nr:YggT family protein [Actinomycetota bacterium]HQZ84400.1 YggT family protein [Actinomycetota bacterium]